MITLYLKLDSSSLIYFAKSNLISLLPDLFDKIVISQEVYQEVITNGIEKNYGDAYFIEKLVQNGTIKVEQVQGKPPEIKLGIGELSIIQLGIMERNEVIYICIDDRKAQRIARRLKIEAYPSEFILFEALIKRKLSFEIFQEKLLQLGKVANFSGDRLFFALKIGKLLAKKIKEE